MSDNQIAAIPGSRQDVPNNEPLPNSSLMGIIMFGRFVSTSTIAMIAISLSVVLIDQMTKAVARLQLMVGQPVRVIPKFFDLSLNFNNGAAFGILPNATPLLIIIAIVLVFAIVRLRAIGKKRLGLRLGLGLLMGGAVGNLIDRIIPPHTVTDFISLHISLAGIQHTWPNFNLADVAIVIGVLLVIFGVNRVERDSLQ